MTGLPRIRPARADEAAALSALALRSKAHWGYDAEFLARCRAELTMTPDAVVAARTHVAVDAALEDETGALLGLVSVTGSPPEGALDALYVDPPAIGRGLGVMLLEAARALARREGFRALLVQSDPHAEAFYLRHGATRIGEVASGSIPGRVLPLLRLAIAGDAG